MTIRVAAIGAGFVRSALLPALRVFDDSVQVVAVEVPGWKAKGELGANSG